MRLLPGVGSRNGFKLAGAANDMHLFPLVIFSTLLLPCFGVDLIAQATNLAATTHVQTNRRSKSVNRLISRNEAGAISTLRTIMTAEATYQSTSGYGNYGTLEQLVEQKLIDYILARGYRHGYAFRIRVEKASSDSPAGFEAVACRRGMAGPG
jgi:hypothetical protein